jgi:large subunit ribosomal protein L6
MSRIGKQTIIIPANTEVKVSGNTVSVKGPKGEISREFKTNLVSLNINGNEITLTPQNEENQTKALWGTYASHAKNMIKGVNDGYEKKLEVEGVGYKWEVTGDKVKFALGLSHPVFMDIPAGLKVVAEKNVLTVSGVDKDVVGEFSAKVRDLKKPEPYKGKGIHYMGEYIRRKQGKKAA